MVLPGIGLLDDDCVLSLLKRQLYGVESPPYFFNIERLLKVPGIAGVLELAGVLENAWVAHLCAVNPDAGPYQQLISCIQRLYF